MEDFFLLFRASLSLFPIFSPISSRRAPKSPHVKHAALVVRVRRRADAELLRAHQLLRRAARLTFARALVGIQPTHLAICRHHDTSTRRERQRDELWGLVGALKVHDCFIIAACACTYLLLGVFAASSSRMLPSTPACMHSTPSPGTVSLENHSNARARVVVVVVIVRWPSSSWPSSSLSTDRASSNMLLSGAAVNCDGTRARSCLARTRSGTSLPSRNALE